MLKGHHRENGDPPDPHRPSRSISCDDPSFARVTGHYYIIPLQEYLQASLLFQASEVKAVKLRFLFPLPFGRAIVDNTSGAVARSGESE